MFALVDANNFYASCERVFRPDLRHKPIVVLSNNDGCVIARSNEAKTLGVAMGVPFFEVKTLCKKHNIQVFSSNYTLYGDLSARVMSVIEDSWPEVEIYSIDEAFLDLTTLPKRLHDSFCIDLQKKILKYIGIPTSIGIGPTKTLAKLANHVAKKVLKIPVFNMTEQRHWLKTIDVGEVWGVGRSWHKKLQQRGIYAAADLASVHYPFIRDRFNVMLMRTAMELGGIACIELEVAEKSKSIMSSRSFGTLQTEYQDLAQAISHHCITAWEKLRKQRLITQNITVFVYSNRHRSDLQQYHNSMEYNLTNATDDISHLVRCAKYCLRKLFKSGIHYKKVGVMLSDLSDKYSRQLDLFSEKTEVQLQRIEAKMQLIEAINGKFGRSTLRIAAEGMAKPWEMLRTMKSPNYTTRWDELPLVKA